MMGGGGEEGEGEGGEGEEEGGARGGVAGFGEGVAILVEEVGGDDGDEEEVGVEVLGVGEGEPLGDGVAERVEGHRDEGVLKGIRGMGINHEWAGMREWGRWAGGIVCRGRFWGDGGGD